MTPKVLHVVRRVARAASPSQWCVRGVVLLAPQVTLLAGGLAGAEVRWWVVVLVAFAALTTAVQPDGHAAGVTLFLLVVFWWWSVPSASGAGVLVAAAAMIALHVGATLAAYGPSTLEIAADLVRVWVRRALLLWAVAFAAWAMARLAPPGGVSLVLALVLVAGVAWWAAVRFGPAAVSGER
ncbi:MAG: hypothetical protein ABI873_11495 [Marmoricola sp.]